MSEARACTDPTHTGDATPKPQRNICDACRSRKRRAQAKAAGSAARPTVMPVVGPFDPDQPDEVPLELLPAGHFVHGISTNIDAEGNIKSQWVKTRVEAQDRAALLLAAVARTAAELPRAEATVIESRAIAAMDDDLLCVVPLGDPHLGMLAWAPETGENFDLRIAERQLYAAADHLIEMAPPARQGLLINAGDFFHADNDKSTTYKGTPVDTDGRYTKVYEAGIRLMRRLIHRMLQKFEHVTVINEIGNHDTSTAEMLSICLAAIYENEPRVTIDTSPQPFHYYRFGKVFIGTHHGDKVKTTELPSVMACDRPEDWGATIHRHWYVGHIHHDVVKEMRGCTVENLRTLAAKDKWHYGQGYRAGRDLKLDVWHREYGKLGRQVVDISLVRVLAEDEGN